MRIWYQSSTPLGRDPLWNEYEYSLKSHVQEVARATSIIDVHGVEVMTPGRERSHYFEDLHTLQIINNAIRAEQEGYDAFALGCLTDSGLLQIRQIINIPTLFAGETSFHLACLLSPNFSVLGFSRPTLLRIEEKIKQYELEERYIPGSAFESDLVQLQQGFSNPGPIISKVTEKAEEMIKRGSCMLVPGCMCLNMILIKHGARKIDNVPILDAVGALVKTAELMVDLKAIGISKSESGLYSPVSKEELAQVRELYGVRETN